MRKPLCCRVKTLAFTKPPSGIRAFLGLFTASFQLLLKLLHLFLNSLLDIKALEHTSPPFALFDLCFHFTDNLVNFQLKIIRDPKCRRLAVTTGSTVRRIGPCESLSNNFFPCQTLNGGLIDCRSSGHCSSGLKLNNLFAKGKRSRE